MPASTRSRATVRRKVKELFRQPRLAAGRPPRPGDVLERPSAAVKNVLGDPHGPVGRAVLPCRPAPLDQIPEFVDERQDAAVGVLGIGQPYHTSMAVDPGPAKAENLALPPVGQVSELREVVDRAPPAAATPQTISHPSRTVPLTRPWACLLDAAPMEAGDHGSPATARGPSPFGTGAGASDASRLPDGRRVPMNCRAPVLNPKTGTTLPAGGERHHETSIPCSRRPAPRTAARMGPRMGPRSYGRRSCATVNVPSAPSSAGLARPEGI